MKRSFVSSASMTVRSAVIAALTTAPLACASGPAHAVQLRLADPAGSLDLFGVQIVDGRLGWAVGDIDPRGVGGRMYRSTDDGRTWTPARATSEVLTGVHFVDAHTGWVAGYAGHIERTDDGGRTWRVQRTEHAGEVLNAVVATDAQHAWAVGARGLILRTSDGGAQWTTIDAGLQEDFWAVAFGSATRGWIAGGRGLVLETSDGGTSWQSVNSPTKSTLYGLAVLPPSTVVAVGEKGTVVRSEGAGWSATRAAETNLNDVAVGEAGTFWAVGDRGAVARSDDAGRTWSALPGLTTARLSAIALSRSSQGVAVGQRGTIVVME